MMHPVLRFPLRLLHMLFLGVTLTCIMLLIMAVYVVSQFDGDAVFPADCGVVFGAAVHSASDPGPGIARRVETAADLIKGGQLHTLILTGGRGSATQESEAAVMRRVAVLLGVEPERVVTEEASGSTWENLLNTRPLTADCDSVVAISDRYHLARIEYLAELQGWDNLQTYPASRIANLRFEAQSVFREAAALIYYYVLPAGVYGDRSLVEAVNS